MNSGGYTIQPMADGRSFPGRWSSYGKGFSTKRSNRCTGRRRETIWGAVRILGHMSWAVARDGKAEIEELDHTYLES